jgi:hypothetical protein
MDLVKTISSVSAAVGKGVDVVPAVPMPLGGIEDPAAIRAAFDLDAWITSGPGVSLGEARAVFWDAVWTAPARPALASDATTCLLACKTLESIRFCRLSSIPLCWQQSPQPLNIWNILIGLSALF